MIDPPYFSLVVRGGYSRPSLLHSDPELVTAKHIRISSSSSWINILVVVGGDRWWGGGESLLREPGGGGYKGSLWNTVSSQWRTFAALLNKIANNKNKIIYRTKPGS